MLLYVLQFSGVFYDPDGQHSLKNSHLIPESSLPSASICQANNERP